MATRRKKRSASPLIVFGIAAIVLAIGAYVKLTSEEGKPEQATAETAVPTPSGEADVATSDFMPAEPVVNAPPGGKKDDPSRTPLASLPWVADRPSPGNGPAYAMRTFQAGQEALDNGDLVQARIKLSDALLAGLPPHEAAEARDNLTHLAEETVFSNRILPDDPLCEAYVIKRGDSLAKIAAEHDITANLLAKINDIENPNRIRAGQRIKVIQGPFHAVVNKETFDLHVYLQDTFIKQYKVGLGTDGSTPTGLWKCKDKLVNPTFYPPRGGEIVPSGDPENPLGERWVGLQGIEGEAVGQLRYGLHGTIEPETIGKAVSMGCIRMHNEDVAQVYDMLVEGDSRVLVTQ